VHDFDRKQGDLRIAMTTESQTVIVCSHPMSRNYVTGKEVDLQ